MAYREGVYDVTEFVEGHPGGRAKIMQAAGGRVDPFRVGNLHPDDRLPETAAPDLYELDPARSPRLVVQSKKPFNGETPADAITEVRESGRAGNALFSFVSRLFHCRSRS